MVAYDDDTVCSICNSEDKLTVEKLLVNNKCGHRFCVSCCDREFARKPQFACPRCKGTQVLVKRTGLTEKTLDQIETQKEITIRRKVLKVFNRTEEDFEDQNEWNDYQEKVEDLIFNLTEGIDVELCNKTIAAYQEQHSREIVANQARDMDSQRVNELLIMAQAAEVENRQHSKLAEVSRRKLKEKKMKAEALEVALGERDAVSSTLMDVMVLGEAHDQPVLLPGQRMLLNINAPMPQPILHSAAKRSYENMPVRQRTKHQKVAGGAPTKADGMVRNWKEAMGSLFACLQT